jgi:cell division protein FtsL
LQLEFHNRTKKLLAIRESIDKLNQKMKSQKKSRHRLKTELASHGLGRNVCDTTSDKRFVSRTH